MDEGATQEEVFGRVAGEGKFGQGDEVAGLGFGLVDGVEDAVGVAGEVADGGIDLGKGDAEGCASGPFHAWRLSTRGERCKGR